MPATVTQPQPPAPAAAPVAPGAPVIPIEVMPGVPRTAQEMAALRSTRSQLSDQLRSAESRRDEVSEQLRENLDPADRAGLIERLGVLDKRILQIESDIATTGRSLAAAPAYLNTTSSTRQQRGNPFDRAIERTDFTAIGTVLSLFVFAPIALAFARRIWKRTTMPLTVHERSDTPQRLERIEQAIDAIAVEVERISEGQRFVTRLLGEANGLSALGIRDASGQETVRIARAE